MDVGACDCGEKRRSPPIFLFLSLLMLALCRTAPSHKLRLEAAQPHPTPDPPHPIPSHPISGRAVGTSILLCCPLPVLPFLLSLIRSRLVFSGGRALPSRWTSRGDVWAAGKWATPLFLLSQLCSPHSDTASPQGASPARLAPQGPG